VATRHVRARLLPVATAGAARMTDDQIWTLFWTVGSYAVTGLGTVAFATWWLKEQLTNSQIKGLEKENAAWQAQIQVVEERRKLAEDRLKDTAEKLANVTAKAQNELKETVASLEAQNASLTTQIKDLQAKAQIDQAQKDLLSEKLARLEQTISTAGRQLGTLSEANNDVFRTLSDSRRLISWPSPISTTLPSGG